MINDQRMLQLKRPSEAEWLLTNPIPATHLFAHRLFREKKKKHLFTSFFLDAWKLKTVMQKVRHHRAEIRKGSFHHGVFFIIFLCSNADSFKVTVPEEKLTAARGFSVVLGCEFSPDLGQNSDFSQLVVTWQRPENNEVVHSFYFKQDQLDKQAFLYHNRTALFVTELSKGNASLKIDNVGVNDAGRYLCTVGSNQETDKAELRLEYAALYTEPRLTMKVNSSAVLLRYETEGYPEAEVKWTGEQLGNHIQTSALLTRDQGLYYIQSTCTAPNIPLNLTFILENQLLHQYVQRHINYSGDENSCFKEVIALAVVSVLLFVTAVIFIWIYYRKTKDGPK